MKNTILPLLIVGLISATLLLSGPVSGIPYMVRVSATTEGDADEESEQQDQGS
jgi:hypothetical protein